MNPNDIKKKLGELAGRAGKKTEEIADTAALKLKLAKLTSDRESELLKLGKLPYKRLSVENNPRDAELAEKISRSVSCIKDMTAQIKELNAECEKRKQDALAQKKARKTKQEELTENEVNTDILDIFSSPESVENTDKTSISNDQPQTKN